MRFIFYVQEPSSCIPHTYELYIIAGQTTALYRRRDRRAEGPHVDAINCERALYAILLFSVARDTYI